MREREKAKVAACSHPLGESPRALRCVLNLKPVPGAKLQDGSMGPFHRDTEGR